MSDEKHELVKVMGTIDNGQIINFNISYLRNLPSGIMRQIAGQLQVIADSAPLPDLSRDNGDGPEEDFQEEIENTNGSSGVRKSRKKKTA